MGMSLGDKSRRAGPIANQSKIWSRRHGCLVLLLVMCVAYSEGRAVASAEDVTARRELPDALQGPAIRMPREILDMLDQRKRLLEQREEAVRAAEARLAALQAEIGQVVARCETAMKAAQEKQEKADAEAQKVSWAQVAKMYEMMPAEEAAARIEKMPNKMALQLLRLLKGKTAGAILALLSPEKAARLTERFITSPERP